MVVIYGMTESVGNVSYYELMKNDTFQKPYSDETARIIDKEVKAIIEEQYERVLALLKERREELIKVAEVLLEKEVIVKDDVVKLIGIRPFEKLEEEAEAATEISTTEENVTEELTEEPSENPIQEDTSPEENEEDLKKED
jgi:cell division protease FtsH